MINNAYADIYSYSDSSKIVHLSDSHKPCFKKLIIDNKGDDSNENNNENDSGGYYIQFGTFSNIKSADNLKTKLHNVGVNALVYQNDKNSYIVWCGSFSTREEANLEGEKLASAKIVKKYTVTSCDETCAAETNETNLGRAAKQMEKTIRAMRFEVKFYTECSLGKNKLEPNVVCIMVFPDKDSRMRYVHKIEAFTVGLVKKFVQNNSVEPFELYAIIKGAGDKTAADQVKRSSVQGDFTGVCAYSYSKSFDRVYSLWPTF